MKSFGTTLKEAREAQGLTTSQVAERTHMIVQIVEALEKEDFKRIPAPIYGRGFVKLYCACVGLDDAVRAQLVTEFMDIYEGRKPPLSQLLAVAPTESDPLAPVVKPASAPEPVAGPASAPEPVADAEPEIRPVVPPAPEPAPAVFAPESVSAPPANGEPVSSPAAPAVPSSVKGLALFDAEAAAAEPLAHIPPESPWVSAYKDDGAQGLTAAERFREGLSCVSHGVLNQARQIPRSVWRLVGIALLVAGLLALAVWGVLALYRMAENPNLVSADETGYAAELREMPVDPSEAKNSSAKDETGQTASRKQPAGKKAPSTTWTLPKAEKLHSTGVNVPPIYVD